MRRDQLHHRLGENLADDVGDMGAAAMPGGEQAPHLQRFQRIAQDRPRHFELPREVTLSRQPVARAQHAFQDQGLDLPHHFVGGARMIDPGEDVAQGNAREKAFAAQNRSIQANWSINLANLWHSRKRLPWRRRPLALALFVA